MIRTILRTGTLVLLGVSMMPLAGGQSLPDGLIAHWTLDTVSGARVADAVGSCHGANFGAVLNVSGVCGTAYEFNGTNQGVAVANAIAGFGAGNFSMAAWVKIPSAFSHSGTVLVEYSGLPLSGISVTTDRRPYFGVRDSAGVAAFVISDQVLEANVWYLMVGVREGSTIVLYVDDQDPESPPSPPVTASAAGLGTVSGSTQWLRIGGVATGPGNLTNPTPTESFFEGTIDEASVYSRALGALDVAKIVATKCPDAESSALARWKLDELSGTTVTDSVGNSEGINFGALQGQSGTCGTAYAFDGVSTGVSAQNTIPNFGAGDYTMTAWVRHDLPEGQSATIFVSYGGLPLTGFGISANHEPQTGMRDGSNNWLEVYGAEPLSPDAWYHLAAVRSGTTLLLYVNGGIGENQPYNASIAAMGTTSGVTSWLRIGSVATSTGSLTDPTPTESFFKGIIDEVTVYRRALRPEEILRLSQIPCESDTTQPVVVVTSPIDHSVTSQAMASVTALILDESATTIASVPPGVSDELAAGGGTVSGTLLLQEGPNVITVSAVDAAGNTGGTSIEVILDTIAPLIDSINPADGIVVGESPVTVSVVVADATPLNVQIGSTLVDVPAGGGTASASIDLVAGANLITITATDAAMNSTTETRTIILDLDAPVVIVENVVDGEVRGPGQQILPLVVTVEDLSATELMSQPAGLSFSLPAGGGQVSGNITLVEGLNTLILSATDETLRVGTASLTVRLDTVAANIEVASPAPDEPVRGIIDFDILVSDVVPGSGVATVEVLVSGAIVASGTNAPFEFAIDTTAFLDGETLFEVRATDRADNVATLILPLIIDNTPPVVSIAMPTSGSFVSGVATFTVIASDVGSGVLSVTQLVGGVPPTSDDSIMFAAPVATTTRQGAEDTTQRPEGPLQWQALARDGAGNETVVTTETTVINLTPPAITLSPGPGAIISGTAALVATVDGVFGEVSIFAENTLLGSSTVSPFSLTFDSTTVLDGPLTISASTTGGSGSVTASSDVVVNNIKVVHLAPRVLNLRARGAAGQRPITLTLEGLSLGLLLPTEAHEITLTVPGGNSVRAVTTWSGDDQLEDFDGDLIPELRLRFSRMELIASLRAAIDAGAIPSHQGIATVPLSVTADGHVLGRTRVLVLGAPQR